MAAPQSPDPDPPLDPPPDEDQTDETDETDGDDEGTEGDDPEQEGPPQDPALVAMGRAFEIEMAEEWLRLHPDEAETLRWLAYAYTAAKRYDEALAADLRLVAARPERAELHYDLACSYALVHRVDDAYDSLERALALGFDDADLVASDSDLFLLRKDPRWRALLARFRAKRKGRK